MDSGIYQITCLVNGKRYIGSSVELKQRWSNHKSDLRKRRHANIHLQRCYDKHGAANLAFEVVERVEPSKLAAAELAWLETEKPELNINQRPDAPMRGKKMSPEHKEKIRAAHKAAGTRPPGFKVGQKHTPETLAKMSEAQKRRWARV